MERGCTVMGGLTMLCIVLFCCQQTTALEPTWISHPDLRFSMNEELQVGEERPKTFAGVGNRDCYVRDVVIRPSNKLAYPIDSSEIRQTLCGQDATYGFISNVFMRTGTEVGGQFVRGNLGLVAGPNLTSGVMSNANGNIFLVPKMIDQLVTIKNSFGEVEHRIQDSSPVLAAKTTSGALLSLANDSISFSSNGRWMLADAPGYGLVRINTETAEVLSFGLPTTYFNGTSPGYQTAISADGRYAVVASGFYQTFKLYDLSSCIGQQSSYPNLRVCQERNLQSTFLEKVNYGTTPTQIRFAGKGEITFYAGAMKNGTRQWRLYRMTMGDIPRWGFEYLGLGDSFASGEGSGQYKPATDDQSANMCHTSTISYPLLAGLQLSKERYDSIACSGAVIDDIHNNFLNRYEGQEKDGITQSQRDIPGLVLSMLPGKITQLTFTEEIDPEAVTISVGGNDIGFDDKIKSCVLGVLPDTTCFNTYEERLEVVKEIETQIPRLVTTYQALAANGRKIYVLGYPKLIDPDGDCADNVHLDNSEADFADKLVVVLNNAIETATKRAGVVYVDVENMLDGHRLCETNSADVYVHGLTAGDELGPGPLKFLSKASFHPKKEAQPLYSYALLEQTNNLTKPMPKPDPTASFSIPAPNDSYWQAQKNGRSTFIPKLIQTLPAFLTKSEPTPITIHDADAWLSPNTDVTIELHSMPINLGTFKTDGHGSLGVTITAPANVSPGYHGLHIYGKNVAGQPVDLYKYLYVLAKGNDADGDGILDNDDPCTFIDPIGEDIDEDGVDDGCDSFVGPAPVKPEPTPEENAGEILQPADDSEPDTTSPDEVLQPTGSLMPGAQQEDNNQQPNDNEINQLPVINPEPIPVVLPTNISDELLVDKDGLHESVAGVEGLSTAQDKIAQPPTHTATSAQLVTIQSIPTQIPTNSGDGPEVLAATSSVEKRQADTDIVHRPSAIAATPATHSNSYWLVWLLGFVLTIPLLVYAQQRIR